MTTDIPADWDTGAEEAPTAVVDPTEEGLDVRDADTPVDQDSEVLDPTTVVTPLEAPDPELDNVVVEFVDLLNARDLDGLGELLAPEVDDDAGTEPRDQVVEVLGNLMLRHPDLVVTRGDRGSTPLVAAWLLDADADEYRFAGIFELELADDSPLIGRLVYVEEPPADDLVLELPEISELPEWEDPENWDEA